MARNPDRCVVRAFDTVFGRFQGAGIASVIASSNPSASARDRVDWLGEQNLFCGWKGFYASGKETTLRIPSLAAFRSTWNGSDQSSQEIPVPWPQPPHLSQAMPTALGPFIPGREAGAQPGGSATAVPGCQDDLELPGAGRARSPGALCRRQSGALATTRGQPGPDSDHRPQALDTTLNQTMPARPAVGLASEFVFDADSRAVARRPGSLPPGEDH